MPEGNTTVTSNDPQDKADELIYPNWADYKFAENKLDKIISEWDDISKEAERQRANRYIRVDEDSLRAEGLFSENQMYVANRLMDSNIRSEQPQYLAYLTQSRREAVFKPKGNKVVQGIENLEMFYTELCRFDSWEKPFIRVVDGSQTHGWDTVEVVFDISKPGHFAIEHVGHENLMFSKDAEDIDSQEVLIRGVELTSIQLRNNVKKFGFEIEQVKLIIGDKPDENNANKKYCVYKCFYKNLQDDLIYVGWFGGKTKCKDWLKVPEPMFLGRRDINNIDPTKMETLPDGTQDFPAIYETDFPFYLLPYTESEDPKIISIYGRCMLDEPSQEAASALLSTLVNGNLNAAMPFMCPEPSPVPPTDNASPKQTELVFKAGTYIDKPIKFFGMAYPPISVIQGYQAVTSSNKAETAKPDYAVENRKDSRKTATEVAAATTEATKLSAVQVTLLSIFMRAVRGRCWSISSNRVLQGKIECDEKIKEMCKVEYNIKAAGDIDVVEREQKLQRQMTSWEVISKTPAAMPFLEDILRNAFPEEADRYIEAIRMGDPGKQLVMQLGQTIKQMAVDPMTGGLKPEYKEIEDILQGLEAQSIAYLNPEMVQENGINPEQQPAAA
jgi:hypothetical protein